jgi:hypothetical protein
MYAIVPKQIIYASVPKQIKYARSGVLAIYMLIMIVCIQLLLNKSYAIPFVVLAS